MQILPSASLAPYIKNYTVVTIEKDLDNEVFYPSGYVDFIINISEGMAATIINGRRKDTPAIELLGHLTLPTRLTVAKGTSILITRIYPHASALFFSDPLSEFTNYATDMYDVAQVENRELYEKIMEADGLTSKINILENHFLQLLKKNETRLKKVSILQGLSQNLFVTNSLNLPAMAQHSGLSERYIQKLYLSNIGISPSAFTSVIRFNKSLHLVLNTSESLTTIAYDCGYYDQAHFIKEFKKFTGITPFASRSSLLKNGTDFQEAVNVGF
ncbi:transcriptional regulator, AraC family [Flavobacterium sp. CF108]|uniref:helix-turn-helix domain-containing protein n=1 Tax=unclassified Flavobacterium TaxID=196869 RepID=UPI0008B3892B|nr:MULTISPECIES: helix-turn-helix domain-containing protein [unclassified Flavobacterium]SEN90951.1 AraC-type DNA-binding protein [Flavobacterium sp. fv08]SHH25591.1 transcriptional regulator, AraC family [Flavobacterium sp. CF108]